MKSTMMTLLLIFASTLLLAEAEIVNVNKASEGQCDGSIDLEVEGTEGPWEYAWSNGASTQDLSGLCAGEYFVTITNTHGCSEVLSAEVEACELLLSEQVTASCPNEQDGSVHLVPHLNNRGSLTYLWEDGSSSNGLYGVPSGNYCVTVTEYERVNKHIVATGCVFQRCFFVPEKDEGACIEDDGGFDPAWPPVIVNELSNGPEFEQEYIELLVIGDGTCDPVDLRGFIIDDNNGDFSYPALVADATERYGLGISMGHLKFSDDPKWANLDPGDIILLFNTLARPLPQGLSNDPDDSNGDGVYILSLDSSFRACSPFPNVNEPYDYGTPITLKCFLGAAWGWSRLSLNNDRDAAQVRYPDGSYCHGLSYGDGTKMNGGPDGINLPTSGYQKVFKFKDDDPRELGNFYFEAASGETPGAANDIENLLFIQSVSCSGLYERHASAPTGFQATVAPNPFKERFSLTIDSDRNGTGEYVLYDMLGKVVKQAGIDLFEGQNQFQVEMDKGHSSGVYKLVLKVEGKKDKAFKLVHIKE